MVEMKLRHLMAPMAGLVLAASALAQGGAGPAIPPRYKDATPIEISRMPKYCYAQYVDGALANNPGYSIQGCGDYMNHYCGGLVKLWRAENSTAPRSQRKENLRMAIDDFEYTLRDMTPGCAIRNDVVGSMARARVMAKFVK